MEMQNKNKQRKDNEKPSGKDRLKEIFHFGAIAGILLGAIGGYVYYIKIGCTSNSCGITSNVWLTMLWGAAIGYLIGDMFKKRRPKQDEKSHEQ